MSTHKVRIYELSRELNLENKDILAVCEQLNIAVKNHSSTITESEAEQIRKTAAQAQPATSHPPRRPSQKSSSGSPVPKPQKRKDRPRKQQILELRKSKPRSNDSGSAPPAPRAQAPTSPPQRSDAPAQAPKPVRPQAAAPAKPAPANAPVAKTPPVLVSPPTTPPQKAATASAKTIATPDIEQAESPSAPVPPQLTSPPSKPVKRSEPSAVPKPRLLQKPRFQERQVLSAPADAPVASRRETSEARPQASPAAATSPPVPTLLESPQRPRKPVPAQAEGSDKSAQRPEKEDSISVVVPMGTATLDPKPTPRVLPKHKRLKTEVEDEDAQGEKSGKVSKSTTKQKRRTQQPVEDDDDDLFGDETNTQSVVDVSRSLVRPPKPKTAKQAKPALSTPRTSSSKGRRQKSRRDRQQQQTVIERPTVVTLTTDLTVQELANQLVVPETEVIKTLFIKGIAANINQILDLETATMVAEELGCAIETGVEESQARKITEMLDVDDLENLHRRPPVVTIMGHVDHGKTTLLDSIRKTKVAQGEAGGITQHIGAYHVDIPHEDEIQQVVFLDTPGHEAFTAMRARGTRVTDIAILVVAADDGVRPQTIEAISHARAANVPIIVAINKMDKEGAQPDRVQQELTEYELVPEEWGGETIIVPVSALKGENLDTLLEMILLVAEVEDLHANPNRPAKGTIIEAHLDKARGPVATFLVQNGTLKVGDTLVAGSVLGKVRAMVDDQMQRVQEAGPSFAVEVLGLNDVPAAGEEFEVFGDDKEARSVASDRSDLQRQTRLQQAMASRRVSLSAFSDQAREGQLKELNLILKADVQGSVEAILGALGQLPQDEVQIRVLLSAPGEISETDVDLASASSAVIIGFNTSLASGARLAADQAGVDIREYSIIYNLLEDIEGAMEGLLEPELVEEPLGSAEVRAVFPVGRGAVAGCYIQNGKVTRNCRIRVRRGEQTIHEGILDSLKRIKEDVREVNAGYECGVGLDSFNDWTEGDIIEAFQFVTKRRTLTT